MQYVRFSSYMTHIQTSIYYFQFSFLSTLFMNIYLIIIFGILIFHKVNKYIWIDLFPRALLPNHLQILSTIANSK